MVHRALVLAVGVAALGGRALSQAPDPVTPRVAREAWRRIDVLVRDRYHDADLNGAPWAAARDEAWRQLDTVTSAPGLYAVLGRWVAVLGDAHTRVHDPLRRTLRQRQEALRTGISIAPVEGEPTVIAVADPQPGAPQVGDRVVAVDGRAVQALFAERRALTTTGSAHSGDYLAWAGLLTGPPGRDVEVTVADTLGRERTHRLSRTTVPISAEVSVRVLEDSVLVLRWDAFRPGVAAAVATQLRQHGALRGVVLDLRHNGGGSADEAGRVVGLFVDSVVPTARTRQRTRSWFGERVREGEWRAGRAGGALWRGPVAVLVSARSGSGAELVTSALREEGRAVVVGERSCGCLLGIRRYEPLPGGGELAVSEIGLRAGRSGRRIEGEGITPDRLVAPTRSALARGEDPVLEDARRALAGGPR
jgi:carboxyl-terminal processing protease